MGGEDFSEYSLPDHSIPAVNFHFGAVDPAKIAEYKTGVEKNCQPCIRANSHRFLSRRFEQAIIGMVTAVLDYEEVTPDIESSREPREITSQLLRDPSSCASLRSG